MKRAGLVLLLLSLGACGWVGVGDRPGAGQQQAKPEPRAATPEGRSIRVQKGDSVYLISRRYGIAMRDIIERNGLSAPYHLKEGQMLILPAPREHVVVAGDSVWLISRQYGVPMAALVRTNGLKKPYTIYKGDRLRIPSRTELPPGEVSDERRDAASPPPADPQKAGASSVAKAPPVPAPTRAARSGSGVPIPRRPPASVSAAKPAPRPAAVSKPLPKTVAEPPPAPVQAALKPLPRRAGRFLRPIEGPVVTGFGPQPDGLHNDGINIAAPRGAAVHAAEAGRVAYSGNELPGYGNLLLIRHRGGWVSAYGHNEQLLVQRGDEVRRGQRIALVGSSGRVTSPQLHFELRRRGRAVDPVPHLKGG